MVEKIYENSPVFVQNLFCSIYGYRAKQKRFNDYYKKKLASLLESQWLSASEIKEYKDEQFRKLIEHSFNTTKFYRKRMTSIGLTPADFRTIDDIVKLPILTKEDVRLNYKDMISTSYNPKKLEKYHTSGSTGKALDFYLTREAVQFQWAVWMRFRKRFGIELYDRSCNFTGKLVVPIGQKKPPFWRYNAPMNQHLISMQHIKQENICSIIAFLEDKKFVFFSGYPSIIYSLALLIEQSGKKLVNTPKYVFTGAEALLQNQREKIQEVFNCIVTDQYGFSECVANASRCKEDVFHEDFEFGHMEFENRVQLSEDIFMGDIISTGFANYGMPFIRYKVGDSAVVSTSKCSCGRSSMSILSIEGRSEDFVITPEGTKIMRFDYLFKSHTEIKECQVMQIKKDTIVFRIVRRKGYTERNEEQLKKDVKKWISPTLKIQFEYLNEIERTQTGKFRAVVSNIN
nr:phenylacetate--CoA ligase family protein [Allomuricauda sp.]